MRKRFHELSAEIRGGIRDVRHARAAAPVPVELGEGPDGDDHADVDLTIIQMKAETLRRVEAALSRLDQGRYGRCTECGGEIAAARLAAVPFAVRCTGCEGAREDALRRRRVTGLLDRDLR